jgi:methyl-accepting chemotaxis protein
VPIRQSVQIAEAVARGDLASEVAVRGADETAKLLGALQRMNHGLADVVAGVRDSSNRIALSSKEIAEGGMDLSHRTEEQAANLQQLVASVEQINGAVQTNAAAAQEAARLASLASAAAGRGSQVMRDVVGTMAEITQASNRIGNITGLIDGIAFQSNILALNAAVEAARAGDAGRGFGVVAGEVRVLAQRSAEAAKDIRRLIEQSVVKVEAGRSRVSDAGGAIVEIASQVDSVNGLINEISTSTTAQTANIAVVHEAIVELDRATQQNAALVEESAAASETLSEYAQSLVDAVAVFRLREGDRMPGAEEGMTPETYQSAPAANNSASV